jgi:DNA polymerase III alpha subunit (gram-positive type)|tara:strand:- start:25102 stop:25674 length:573 start_codon:yes stop_codon:yes gene_type:complete
MTNQKFAFIDVETTGLDEKEHDVIQFACIVTDSELNELGRIRLEMQPTKDNAEAQAMEKTGLTVEQIMAYADTSATGYAKLITFLGQFVNKYEKKDKLQFVAYNALFDCKFVREWFSRNDDVYFGSWFWWPPICVMMEGAWLVRNNRASFIDFKLQTLCEAADIVWDETKAHDAMYDIEQTIQLYRYLSE